MGQQRWKNEAFKAFSGQHAWHIYTQLDAEPSLSEGLQTIDEYCPSGLITGIVRHPSTWTGILKGYYSPSLNGMRTKPGPPQDSQASFEDLTECAAHQDEQKTSAEAAALALRACCLYGWAKVPLLCIQHADPWRGRLLHADLAMRCFQGQDSCDMMLMAKMIFCPVGYRIARPDTFAFLLPQELRQGITSARRCPVALWWWLQALQHCWWVVAS